MNIIKRALQAATVATLAILAVTACAESTEELVTHQSTAGLSAAEPIRIGVVDGEEPYWVTLAAAAEAQGIYVEVQNFGDYTLLNQALVEGDLELNQFQHLDYLANFNVASGNNLVPIGATATYPMALFSARWDSVADIPDGAEIAIPNDPTNLARALLVLQDAGLLTLQGGGTRQSTAYDVIPAESRVSVIAVDAAQTAASLQDLDGAIVNNDMIGQIGLSLADAVYADNPESAASAPYINIWVARAADYDNPTFAQLVSIFHNTPAVIDGLQEANAHSAVISNTPQPELLRILDGLQTDLGGVPTSATATPSLDHRYLWALRLIIPIVAVAALALVMGRQKLRARQANQVVAPESVAQLPVRDAAWEEAHPATGAIGVAVRSSDYHPGKPIISFKHASKIFPATKRRAETRAVDDVTFDIYEGEVFAVIGYSGAGKSTLVRLINGLERPTSGSVIVDGTDISRLSESRLRPVRQDIGMVFQSFNLLSSRTVAGNVSYPLEVAGWSRAARKERVAELLDYVGLSSMAGAYPNQLSGGQRQRVGVARALATNPKILLADEATSALDPETTQDVLRLLRQINRDLDITVVVITHSMSVVRYLCDRVAVMDHGQVVELGDVYTVFGSPQAPITRRFVGTALADRPTVEVLDRLRERHHGRLVTVNVREGSTKAFARIFATQNVDAEVVFGGITEVGARPVGALTFEITGPADQVDAAVAAMLTQSDGEDHGVAEPQYPGVVVPDSAESFADERADRDLGAGRIRRREVVGDVLPDGTVYIQSKKGHLR